MSKIIGINSPEDNRFLTISYFEWCVNGGGAVEFVYNNKTFGIAPKLKCTPDSPMPMLISQTGTEQWYDTADQALEYKIDGTRLRDIITEVKVTDHMI